MSEEVKKELEAYKEGYRDGYNDAAKLFATNPISITNLDAYRCPVCGITGFHLSVCYNPKCPSKITC